MPGPPASSNLSVFLAESSVRAFVWMVTRLFYPLRVRGLENVPRHGGALLISNHVSFVDWVLLTAAAKRPVRFLISKEFYESPWLNPFVRVARVIPIPSGLRPHEVSHALRNCSDAICNGNVVCVFPEGGITRTGALQPFQRGFEKVMTLVARASRPCVSPETDDAPERKLTGGMPVPLIVPVALTGVGGSVFSFAGGKFFWKWPRQLRRPVTVNFGQPLPPAATADEVRQAVERLLASPNADGRNEAREKKPGPGLNH